MNRIIKSMEDKYVKPSLDMVRRTFTDSENAEEADLVVRLIEEIRSMDTYIPELELVMVNDEDEVIGYAMFPASTSEGNIERSFCFSLP